MCTALVRKRDEAAGTVDRLTLTHPHNKHDSLRVLVVRLEMVVLL